MNNLPFNVYNQHIQNSKTHALYPTTQSLIKYYSDLYKDHYRNADGTKRLIRRMKTNNFNKLFNNRKEWDKLSSRIPIEYLEALGITENLIATAVEIDQEIYDKKIAEPITYSGFVHHIHAIVVKYFAFKEPLSESEAVEEIKQMLSENKIELFYNRTYFALNRSPYYSLYINQKGEKMCMNNRPEYRIENPYYVFRLPFFSGFRLR